MGQGQFCTFCQQMLKIKVKGHETTVQRQIRSRRARSPVEQHRTERCHMGYIEAEQTIVVTYYAIVLSEHSLAETMPLAGMVLLARV